MFVQYFWLIGLHELLPRSTQKAEVVIVTAST